MKRQRLRTDRIAEDEVAIICRAAGASVQKVNEDEHGWDLLVEFPPRIETAFPDTEPSILRCLVQVKSTQSRRTSTRVKISNSLKFAKDILPCFVVLLTYPNSRTKFEAAYVKHIWATDMAQALKAARHASASGQELHKHYLPINFSSSEQLNEGIVDAMIETIDRIGKDYHLKKKALSDNLGYEEGWGEANFVLADGHGPADLQDLLLGLRPDLPLQSFTLTDRRFGIPGQPKTNGAGVLSVEVEPTSKCVVTLSRKDDGREISWTGVLFAAGLSWLSPDEQKARICAGPIELVISGDGQAKFNWSSPLDLEKPLDDLERDATFRSWMDGSALELMIWTDRGSLKPFNVNFHRKEERDWAAILYAIRALAKVVPPERRPNDFKVSMKQVLNRLTYYERFANSTRTESLPFKIEGDDISDLDLDEASHIVFPWPARVGDYYLVAVIERDIISLTRDKKSIYLKTINGRLLRGTLIPASAATDLLVEGEVRWARDRSLQSGKRIMSFHPGEDGFGSIELTDFTSED